MTTQPCSHYIQQHINSTYQVDIMGTYLDSPLCRAKVLLTATGSMRGKKPILLKQIADEGIDIAAQQGFQVHLPLQNFCSLVTKILPYNTCCLAWKSTSLCTGIEK